MRAPHPGAHHRCLARSAAVAAAALIAGLLPGRPLAAQSAPSSADTSWTQLYLRDLAAARDVISADHPGAVDSANPAFARTLTSAYAEARAAAAAVGDYSSYRIALARFGNRFQDAHLSIGGRRPIEGVREAGIFPVWRGGEFVIAEADARYGATGEALRGATVASCDGRPARDLFAARVLSWRGRREVAADWYTWAPMLLVDFGAPTPPGPKSCVMNQGGRRVVVSLQWRETTSAGASTIQRRLSVIPRRPLGVTSLEGGRVVWADFSTFAVNDSSSIAAMHAALDSLDRMLKASRARDLLVFDLRGNDGGSSVWGDRIAASVFGEDWAAQGRAWLGDGVYTEWRVSPGNLEAVRGLVKQVEERQGAASADAAAMRAFADSMQAAHARGQQLYGVPSPRQGLSRPDPVAIPGRVVVIAGPECFSACLDFLDRMRVHPAVVQVGTITGVDTDYMENWGKPLPSGLSSVGHPMKVYRGRRRGNNEAYAPHVPYGDDLGDTAALRAWVVRRFGGKR